MLRKSSVSLLTLLALCSLAQGADEIYRWVDESGGVHYGDQPPPSNALNVRAMEIEIRPAPDGAAEDYSIHSQLERLYRTRPVLPEKPDKRSRPPEAPYPGPPPVIYRPLYAPVYGHPGKHRPARPGLRPRPPHGPNPAPPPQRAPSGRLWLPR
jgi:hypothetical protein